MDNILNSKEFIMHAKDPGQWYRLADWLKYSAMILETQLDRLFELYLAAIDKYGEESEDDEYEPPRLFRRLCYVSPATMTGTSCLW